MRAISSLSSLMVPPPRRDASYRCGLEYFLRTSRRMTVGFYPLIVVNALARGAFARNRNSSLLSATKQKYLDLPLAPGRSFSRREPNPAREVWQSVDLGRMSDAERATMPQ